MSLINTYLKKANFLISKFVKLDFLLDGLMPTKEELVLVSPDKKIEFISMILNYQKSHLEVVNKILKEEDILTEIELNLIHLFRQVPENKKQQITDRLEALIKGLKGSSNG